MRFSLLNAAFRGAFLTLALAACSPDRARLNPLDPGTSADAQVQIYSPTCSQNPSYEFRFQFPHGIQLPMVNPVNVSGLISVSPLPLTTGATAWRWTSAASSPEMGTVLKTITYGTLNFVAGQTYTIKVSSAARDQYDRPFSPVTTTFRVPLYGSPSLTLTVLPISPPANGFPNFAWPTSDFERFRLQVYKAGVSQWDTGILVGSTTFMTYGTGSSYIPLSTGSYAATLTLYNNCNVLQNSAAAAFSVP
jgi:hypothetical protein